MAHFEDLRLGNLLMGIAKRGAELTSCFADNLDMVNHPGMNEFVSLEDGPISLRIPFDPIDGIENFV